MSSAEGADSEAWAAVHASRPPEPNVDSSKRRKHSDEVLPVGECSTGSTGSSRLFCWQDLRCHIKAKACQIK